MADTLSAGPLHVVTGGDENYAPGIMVLANSLWRHNPGARVTVLGLGLSDASTGLMRDLAAAVGGEIEVMPVSGADLDGLESRNPNLSAATYLRLEIPRLLPDAARVIYLDSDMVVTGSLAPLWDMALGDALIAAVPDPGVGVEELRAVQVAAGKYVNSGLMVMNLKLWRAEETARKCRAAFALRDAELPMQFEDQSAINMVCRDRILPLPVIWNFFSREHKIYTAQEMAARPKVVHFVWPQKPWLYSGAPAEALWLAEADALPIGMPALQRKPVQQPERHLLAPVERWLRLHLYAALGIRNYRERYAKSKVESAMAKVDADRLRQWEAQFIAPHVAAIAASAGAQAGTPGRSSDS